MREQGMEESLVGHFQAVNMTITVVRCIIVADEERLFEWRQVQITLSCSTVTATGTAMGKIIQKV